VIGKITGTDTGLGKRAMKEHWDEYFELDAVESLTDNTMLEYVKPLKDKMRKRFL
jgi:hypothetical protein